jgi:hypothetical protein
MIPRRRLPRALALACCTAAFIPAVAGARPAIDPPVDSTANAPAAVSSTPLRGPDDDRAIASDSDAMAIATAAGGVLLVAGIAAQVTRRRRRARMASSRT